MQLTHVTLLVEQLDRSVAFYAALGMQLIVYAPPRYARFIVPGNQATLSFEVHPDAAHGVGRAQIFLECEDVDATCRWLSASGISLRREAADMPYLWREAWLADPDGHDVRLFSAGPNRLAPPWTLAPETADAIVSRLMARHYPTMD